MSDLEKLFLRHYVTLAILKIHPPSDKISKVTFKVPISLRDAYEHENEGRNLCESLSRSSKRVVWAGDKLRMEPDSARELFSSPCQHITDHLQTIFDDEKVKGTHKTSPSMIVFLSSGSVPSSNGEFVFTP
jgi:hypothetical protein